MFVAPGGEIYGDGVGSFWNSWADKRRFDAVVAYDVLPTDECVESAWGERAKRWHSA